MTIWTIKCIGEARGHKVYSLEKTKARTTVTLGKTATSVEELLTRIQQLLEPGDKVVEPSGTYMVRSPMRAGKAN